MSRNPCLNCDPYVTKFEPLFNGFKEVDRNYDVKNDVLITLSALISDEPNDNFNEEYFSDAALSLIVS